MAEFNYLVVIPARYGSSRLPGKPLIELEGVPMIVRTYRQCIKAVPRDKVVVATDDDRVRLCCEAEGIRVLMTSSQCLTGTDRVAEVAKRISADTYINVQGDEPIFNPDDLRLLLEVAKENKDSVVNGYCEILEEERFRSFTIPKVVVRPDGRLLYMSRASIPATKGDRFVRGWRQVCAYAFPYNALQDFAGSKTKTPLEAMEDIEILRFLEIGWEVKMVKMSAQSISVDTPEDVPRVEHAIRVLGQACSDN